MSDAAVMLCCDQANYDLETVSPEGEIEDSGITRQRGQSGHQIVGRENINTIQHHSWGGCVVRERERDRQC